MGALKMKAREFKDAVFNQFARLAQAMCSPKRLEIIDILIQGERDVETIARETNLTVANTSRHLQVLKNAHLVDFRKDGVRAFYRISDTAVYNCWKNLQSLAENLLPEVRDAVQRFYREREAMEAISKDELLRRIEKGEAVALDVRPEDEYISGHVRGAISIPLHELKKRLKEIPSRKEIIAYCRGPYCVLAVEAVTILRDAGFKALRLEEGFPEWKSADMPVETGVSAS
jgi:rhodanese-related sulfurtransferase